MSTSWRRSAAYQSLTDQASFVVPLKSMVSIKLSSARHPPIGLWTRASLMEVFPLEGKLDDDEIPSWNLSLPFRFSISRIMNISFFFLPPPCKRVYRALFKPKIQHLYRNRCVYVVTRRFEIGEIWKIKNIVLVTLKFKLKEKIYYDF